MGRARRRIRVLLEHPGILGREVAARVQHLLHAREAGEGSGGLEEERRIVPRGMDVVVGGSHPSALRVVFGGQIIAESVPFEFPGPGHRQPPVPVGPARRERGGLPGDVPVGVPADHVLRRSQPVAHLLQEAAAVGDHVEPQTGQVSRGSGFVHGRAHGVGEVVLGIPVEDGAVARELELQGYRFAIPDLDGFGDGPHLLPAVAPAHLLRVVRVHLLDVHVGLVGADDGQPPGDAPVVPDGHPRKHRLGRTDGGPAGRVQVHDVAKRRVGHPAVRVVGHDRVAARGAASVDRPVVAPRGGLSRAEVERHLRPRPAVVGGDQGRTAHRVAEPRHARQYVARDERHVDARGHLELPPRGRIRLPVGFLRAQLGHPRRQLQLAPHIRQRHRRLHAQQRRLGAPVLGFETREQELHGQLPGRRRVIDVGVDPRSEGLQDAPALGVVGGELGVVERAAEHEQARDAVVLQGLRAQHFAQPPLAGPPVHLHLPETVLGLDEALREEEVVEARGIDVGDAPGVAQHFDLAREPRNFDAAIDLGQLRLCQLLEACGRSFSARADEREKAECGDGDAAGVPGEYGDRDGAHGFSRGSVAAGRGAGMRAG